MMTGATSDGRYDHGPGPGRENIFALLTAYEREHVVASTMYVGLKRKLTPMQMDQYAFNVATEMLRGPRLNAPAEWSIVQWAISLGTSRLKRRSSGQQ
jgi:hypothetical protein